MQFLWSFSNTFLVSHIVTMFWF